MDAIIGDGDMGVTVELGSMAMADYLANPGEEDIGKLLMKCGMQINKSTPVHLRYATRVGVHGGR